MILSLFTAFPAIGSFAADTLESSVYYIDHEAGFLYDVENGSQVSVLKQNLKNSANSVTVYDLSGNALADSSYLATGYTVSCGAETVTILVKGDNNGDGAISTVDILSVTRYLSGYDVFSDAHIAASDVDYDNVVSTTDYAILRAYLEGSGDLNSYKHPKTPTGEDDSSVVYEDCTVSFMAGTGGTLSGTTEFTVEYGTDFSEITVPKVSSNAGYVFTGWTPSFPTTVTKDI